MVLSYTEDFEVTWANPEDATEHWICQSFRFPDPKPLLNQEVITVFQERFLGSSGGRTIWVNGYSFIRLPSSAPLPAPEITERGTADVWFNDYQYRVRDTAERLRERDYDSMSNQDLAANLEALFKEMAEAFLYTAIIMANGNYAPTQALVRFCELEMGDEGPRLAAGLLQGFSNRTADSGEKMSSLAQTAAEYPELAAALGQGTFDELDQFDGGQEFLRQFGEYLDEYGWRLQEWGDSTSQPGKRSLSWR